MGMQALEKCRLCLEYSPLCDSHIIPHHFFRKRENGSGMYEIIAGAPIKKRIPRGWTEKLLCTACEIHIGKFDDYAAKFFSGSDGWEIIDVKEIHMRLFVVHDYDYRLLKLFFLSLLWRSVVASIPAFEAVSFSSQYQEELRQMLVNCEPGKEHDYGTVIFKYEPHEKEYEKITFSPHRIRHPGCVTYFQLQLNEFPCRMKVSNQEDALRYEGFWLSEVAPLRIMEVPLIPQHFNTMVKMVQTQPKLLEAYRKQHEVRRGSKI